MSHTSKLGLAISLSLLGGILLGAGIFFGWYFLMGQAEPTDDSARSAQEDTANSTEVVPTNTDKESSDTVPSDWKTYNGKDYDLSFSYPPEWGSPKVDSTTGVGNSLYGFAEEGLTFDFNLPEGSNAFRSVRIAKIEDILAATDQQDSRVPDATKLLDVYKNRAVGKEILVVPPVNAGVAAATNPTYIESADGSFRGMYYYSFSTQSALPDDPALLMELQIVMTNGDVVISFYRRSDYTNDTPNGSNEIGIAKLQPEGTSKPAETCQPGQLEDINPPSKAAENCEIDSVLLDEFNNDYGLVIFSLE
ncbi:MAG: hypothetical protein U0517_03695 [Candidatus Andersenbacteria bacterium]